MILPSSFTGCNGHTQPTQPTNSNQHIDSNLSENVLKDVEFLVTTASSSSKIFTSYDIEKVCLCIARLYHHSRKIAAIKMIMAITGIDLREAKEFYNQYVYPSNFQ